MARRLPARDKVTKFNLNSFLDKAAVSWISGNHDPSAFLPGMEKLASECRKRMSKASSLRIRNEITC